MEKRKNMMSFRANDIEYSTIKNRAEELNMTMGKFMRTAVLDFDNELKAPAPEAKNNLHIMSRIGNNFNQIAKALNERGSNNPNIIERLEKNLTYLEELVSKSIIK